MKALDCLRSEIPFHECSREELEKALLSVSLKQVTKRDVLPDSHGQYWLSLEGVLWFVLLGEKDPDAPQKHREMAALVRRAVAELTEPKEKL